jgi:hypothetical protein
VQDVLATTVPVVPAELDGPPSFRNSASLSGSRAWVQS